MRRFALVLCVALGLVACTDDLNGAEESFVNSEVTGIVRMPLAARGTDGKTYRLRNATFEITGAAMFTVSDRASTEVRADALATTVPPGNYSVYLRPGWELFVESETGESEKAEATLASTNPMAFEIGRTLDTRLTLTVRMGDKDVVFGSTAPVQVTSAENDSNSAL